MLSFILLALAPTFFSVVHSQSCSSVSNIKLTYYGFADGNSDQTSVGCAGGVASNQGGKAGGGSGSYDNPFSFATQQGSTNFKECEKIYVPYLKKYFIYMDHCTGCDSNHIDLWVGNGVSGGQAQINCELALGSQDGQTIVKDPPSNLPVVAQNIWDGSCHNVVGSTLFPNADASNLCSGGGGGSDPGPPAKSPPAVPVTSNPSTPPPPPPTPTPTPSTTTTSSTSSSTSTPTIPATKPTSNEHSVPGTHNQQKAKVEDPPAPKSSSPTTLQTVTRTQTGDSKFGAVWSPPPIVQPVCLWKGHCIGDPCQTYDDCSGEWICIAGKCHDNLTD